ncbi:MAG: ATP-binding cassette domain-containing protein [Candidatus Aureabacteria bacterium]|nr:ATP-binding cassette domain-containing protein [Candidatus Auribacterota bacterium]
MITAEGLTKSYGSDFTLSIERFECAGGEVTALLGPNGSGKSTLLGVLAGLISADGGVIRMGRVQLRAGSPAGLEWRRAVTLVLQKPFMFDGTVEENVGRGLAFRGVAWRERRRMVRDALEWAGLAGRPGLSVSPAGSRALSTAGLYLLIPPQTR